MAGTIREEIKKRRENSRGGDQTEKKGADGFFWFVVLRSKERKEKRLEGFFF